MNEYQIVLEWDEEGNCWLATSEGQSNCGLTLVHNSLEVLIENVKYAIKDLTNELNFKIKYNLKYTSEVVDGR